MSLLFPFFAGILAFLSPCVVPMITVYLSLITGLTVDELFEKETALVRRDIIINTAFFVGGYAVVYIAAGAAAGYVGRWLSDYQTPLNRVGGVIIILLGLRFAGLFKSPRIKPFARLKQFKLMPRSAPEGTGAFGFGVLFAVICSHCFGGLLASVLLVAGVSGSQTHGAFSLALFSLGLAVPFMLTAFGVTAVVDRLKAAQDKLWLFTLISGLFMVVLGVFTFFGWYTSFAQFFGAWAPVK